MNPQLICHHCKSCFEIGKNAILFSNEVIHDSTKTSHYLGEKNTNFDILDSLLSANAKNMPGRYDFVLPISWWDKQRVGLTKESARIISYGCAQDVINAFDRNETNSWVCGKCYKSNSYPTSFADDLRSISV